MSGPLERLRHHVTGAIERGEGVAIVERPTAELALERFERDHGAAACAEGWCISDCGGDVYQLQRLDDVRDIPRSTGEPLPPQLADDGKAWRIVLEGQQPHHIAARGFLAEHARQEYDAIVKFCSGRQS